MMSRETFLLAVLLAFATCATAAKSVEGFQVDEVAMLASSPLRLNGTGYRKRGSARIHVTSIYCEQYADTLEALENMPGRKKIRLILLQDVSSSQAERFFVSDFEAAASSSEFKLLINDISAIGAIYGSIPSLRKGDVIDLDMVPGRGIMSSRNGTPMIGPNRSSPWFERELLGRIFLRMYVGGKTPIELRNNLLGLSRSMQD